MENRKAITLNFAKIDSGRFADLALIASICSPAAPMPDGDVTFELAPKS
jgi:hypothetical protein